MSYSWPKFKDLIPTSFLSGDCQSWRQISTSPYDLVYHYCFPLQSGVGRCDKRGLCGRVFWALHQNTSSNLSEIWNTGGHYDLPSPYQYLANLQAGQPRNQQFPSTQSRFACTPNHGCLNPNEWELCALS